MFNIGGGEVLLISAVALLILGPKRLPEMARTLGKAVRAIRRQTDSVRGVVEQEFYKMDEDLKKDVIAPKLLEEVSNLLQQPPEGAVARGQTLAEPSNSISSPVAEAEDKDHGA